MKNSRILIFAAALLTLGAGAASAATATAGHDITINVKEVALLGLDETGTLVFDIGAPENPGEAFTVTPPADAVKYLQYTSIVATGKERKITAHISAGSLPSGFGLTLKATDASGGRGNLGSAVGSIPLTSSATEIVTGIGSGYTKTAGPHGVKVEYSLDEIDCEGDACNFVVDETDLTVIYTLTEDI